MGASESKYQKQVDDYEQAMNRQDLAAVKKAIKRFPESEKVFLKLPLWHRLILFSLNANPEFVQQVVIILKENYVLVEKNNTEFELRLWFARGGKLKSTVYWRRYDVESGVETTKFDEMNALQFAGKLLSHFQDPYLAICHDTKHNLNQEVFNRVIYNLLMIQHYVTIMPGKSSELVTFTYPPYVPVQRTVPTPTAPPASEMKIVNENNGKEQKIEEDENTNCIICFEKKKDQLILPCRHLALCSDCIPGIKELGSCPVCRATITQILKVYDVSL